MSLAASNPANWLQATLYLSMATMQVMGVPISEWGTRSMRATTGVPEILA